jgi:hypothetical protein
LGHNWAPKEGLDNVWRTYGHLAHPRVNFVHRKCHPGFQIRIERDNEFLVGLSALYFYVDIYVTKKTCFYTLEYLHLFSFNEWIGQLPFRIEDAKMCNSSAVYNRTAKAVMLEIQGQQLPIYQLKGMPTLEARPISNLHQCKSE